MNRRFGGLNRIMLVLNRGRWASEIINFVDLNIQRKRDIVTDELETGVLVQVLNVAFAACKEVINADYLVSFLKKSINEMRPEKSGSAGN